jgi:4-oxalocrotonate tautomerase
MPIIQVNILEGRTDEQKENLIQELTKACERAIDAPVASVRILINELPKAHFGIAGKSAKKMGK